MKSFYPNSNSSKKTKIKKLESLKIEINSGNLSKLELAEKIKEAKKIYIELTNPVLKLI